MRTSVKKKVAIVISCAIVSVFAMGCGKDNNQKTGTKDLTIDVEQLAEQIVTEGTFTDELAVLDNDMFETEYPDVDSSLVYKKCVYVGSGATTEQIVVIEAKEEGSVEQIKEGLNQKIDDDIEASADYQPTEVPKLQDAVLTSEGKYVIMVVSGDSKKVEEIIEKVTE